VPLDPAEVAMNSDEVIVLRPGKLTVIEDHNVLDEASGKTPFLTLTPPTDKPADGLSETATASARKFWLKCLRRVTTATPIKNCRRIVGNADHPACRVTVAYALPFQPGPINGAFYSEAAELDLSDRRCLILIGGVPRPRSRNGNATAGARILIPWSAIGSMSLHTEMPVAAKR
jgi:hypothetical protein